MTVCAKYQRHCGAYLALQEAADMEWAEAETLTAASITASWVGAPDWSGVAGSSARLR